MQQRPSEALHVLDALLYHQSEVPVGRHHTDGGGDSDHVFALCSLLGFQFSPCIPDLKHSRLYSFGKPSDHPMLEPMIGGRINVALIRAYWKAILRIVASVRTGTVTASVIMRQPCDEPVHITSRMWRSGPNTVDRAALNSPRTNNSSSM